MSKLNIFKTEWIDMVFEGRNKAYGAYQLRSENPRTTTRALFIGAVLFAAVIAGPVVKNIISQSIANDDEESRDKVIETALIPPPEEEKKLPPPPPEPPKSVNDQVKFPPPEVVKKELVKDEDPPTVEDLKDADPGQKDAKGDKNAEIPIDVPTGEGEAQAQVTEDNKVYVAVEVLADPPGGMAKFRDKFASNLTSQLPEVDEGVAQIKVMLNFVVEKDGSFTDVKVLRDPGYGVGKIAIKVLNGMPKWKPAIQNGRPVRSQFTLPITIQTGQ